MQGGAPTAHEVLSECGFFGPHRVKFPSSAKTYQDFKEPYSFAAMKMAPRRLKINNLQSDLMQTPFSCKVERQRRMKSYRNVALGGRRSGFPHSGNPGGLNGSTQH